MNRHSLWLIALLLLLAAPLVSWGQTASDVQSDARPYGLAIADEVMIGGSDASSQTFMDTLLPSLSSMLNASLGGQSSLPGVSSFAVDPANLYLQNDAAVRMYFVGEDSTRRDSLGYNSVAGITSGDPLLIFPNASSPNKKRKENEPLIAGDFVDLGSLDAGALLDFFLIVDGARENPDGVLTTDSSLNPDGLNHFVAYGIEDSSYLLIGIEDSLGGGDLDYNDLLFAVDIGQNVNYMVNSEPATGLTLASLLAVCLFAWHRQKISA